MRVVILAAGSSERMARMLGGLAGKPWIHVGGETLIHRTYRICGELGFVAGAIVLATHEETGVKIPVHLSDLGNPANGAHTTLGVCETTVERMRQVLAQPSCAEGCTFLLGDVFYSRAALRTILTDGTDPCWYGRKGRHPIWERGDDGEVYAVRVGLEGIDLVRREADRLRAGKLRWLHDAIAARYPKMISRAWHEIADYTDDFDVPEDLDRSPEMARMAAEET